jgi:hypothetical protein
MAEPKCPECSTGGKRHIVAEESDLASKDGDPWFEIVYCDQCGHVYGGLSKARACAQCSIHPEDLANFSIPRANPKPPLLSFGFLAIFRPLWLRSTSLASAHTITADHRSLLSWQTI